MTEHTLKCWPPYFAAIKSGDKPFEVRRDDRGFQKGDILKLQEWNYDSGYTGREIRRRVTWILTGGQFGIEPGFVVMGITPEGRHSMPIKDLCDEFIMGGHGELNLSGCKMPYIVGPDGKREWQQLIFWGGHGASNRLFVANPLPGMDAHLLEGRVIVRTDPIPPGVSTDVLMAAAQAVARAVLEALANK